MISTALLCGGGGQGLVLIHQLLVNLDVVAGHPSRSESLFEHFTASPTADCAQPSDSIHRFLNTLHDETSDTVVNHFRHGPVAIGNYGSAAGHRFDHRQAEGFRPIDGKQQRPGISEKTL